MENKDMTPKPNENAKSASILNNLDNNRKLFICGIGMTLSESELYNYFSQYGEIKDVIIIINPYNGLPKGYGFIEFADEKSVDDVMQTERYHNIADQKIEVKRVDPKSKKRVNSANIKRLFVGGIDETIDERELYNYFTWFGKIDEISIKFHPRSGEPKGYGFVQFVNIESAYNALRNIFHNINNTIVEVRISRPKDRYSRRSKIFVGSLTSEMTEDDIMNCFVQFGEIIDFHQPIDLETNQKKRFCFVTFKDFKVVDEILKNRVLINGIEVNVDKVKYNPGFVGTKHLTMFGIYRPPVSMPGHYNFVPLSENIVDFNSPYHNGYGYGYAHTDYNYKNVNAFYPVSYY